MATDQQDLEQLREKLSKAEQENAELKAHIAALESLLKVHGVELPPKATVH